jgi:hypothetical protein
VCCKVVDSTRTKVTQKTLKTSKKTRLFGKALPSGKALLQAMKKKPLFVKGLQRAGVVAG